MATLFYMEYYVILLLYCFLCYILYASKFYILSRALEYTKIVLMNAFHPSVLMGC